MFKKSLIAVSVLMLALAGAALAGDTNWTFYGVGHVSINSLNNGTDSQLGATSNTSRFGFRGTSAIDDNLSAFWQFESLLNAVGKNQNAATVTSWQPTFDEHGAVTDWNEVTSQVTVRGVLVGTRNTFVGIKHASAGKFLVGYHDTPFKTLGRKVEMFPDQLGDFRAMTFNWDNRLSEIAAWISPDWNGFSMFAAYEFDQGDPGAPDAKTAMSTMASYATKEFMVGAAYEALSTGFGPVNGAQVGNGPNALRLAGKYTSDQVDVGLLYQTATVQKPSEAAFADLVSTVLGAGATFHANEKWNVKGAIFISNSDTKAADVAGTADVDESDTKATMLAFGIDRVFTPSVLCYAKFGTISNGDMTNVALGGAQSGFGKATSGTLDSQSKLQNPSGISVGTVVTW